MCAPACCCSSARVGWAVDREPHGRARWQRGCACKRHAQLACMQPWAAGAWAPPPPPIASQRSHLAGDHQAGGQVSDAHSAVCCVDVLPARAARPAAGGEEGRGAHGLERALGPGSCRRRRRARGPTCHARQPHEANRSLHPSCKNSGPTCTCRCGCPHPGSPPRRPPPAAAPPPTPCSCACARLPRGW